MSDPRRPGGGLRLGFFWAFHFFMTAHPRDRNQDPAQGARLSVLYCSVFTRNIHFGHTEDITKIESDLDWTL